MKRLVIMYGDNVICDSDQVEQFQHTETPDGVSVTARFTPPASAKPTAGLLDLLTSARRQQTQTAIADQRRPPGSDATGSEDVP